MFRALLAPALIATALVATATPALANRLAHTPQQISDARKEGCTVQHVHTPAGKIVHSPAIVHCSKASAVEVAKAQPRVGTVLADNN